jgi:MFS transporter, DHA1 family, multidrug resistance protein
MYLPALPTLTRDLHTSPSTAQLSLTFCLLGLALGQLLAGPISDARGRRGPLMMGLAVYAIASLLCVVAPNVWLLVILRLVQGAAGSAGIVIARAIVRDLYAGPAMTRFFALLMLVNGAAPILAPVAGGQLLRLTSWRGVFVVLAVLGVLMLLAVWLGLSETLLPDRRSVGGIVRTMSTFWRLLRDRTFMGYAWSQGLVTGAMFAYISGSPFVLQDIFGLSAQTFSLVFAMNGLGIIVASQCSGRLAGRIRASRILTVGLLYALFGGILLLLSVLTQGGLPLILPALFIVVSSVGIVGPPSTSLAMQKQGQSAGSAAALIGVPQLMIGAVIAPLVGLGGSHTAMPMAVIITVCTCGALMCYTGLIQFNQKVGQQHLDG